MILHDVYEHDTKEIDKLKICDVLASCVCISQRERRNEKKRVELSLYWKEVILGW